MALNDFDLFMESAVKFINETVPTATKSKRASAAADLGKAFRFLFDKDGKRLAKEIKNP